MPRDEIDGGRTEHLPGGAEAKGGLSRRSFLQIAAGATGAAMATKATVARAGNGWSMGLEGVPREKLLWMYETMLKSRWWEEEMKEAFLAGKDGLYGAFHISIGEEASAVGVMAALREDDYIASNHRGHAHLVAKGGDIDKMSGELFFRSNGYNLGFGGSMHITDVSKGILGMNGIIGPQYLFAAGAGYSAKVRGTDQVAVAFGGDGSVNNGWYYSGLRNAALYKLPMIAVIENNGYQISMPQARTNNLVNLSQLGAGMDIPHETVNGMDVLAVYAVTQRAVARARRGDGPTLIEAKNYRYYDHSGLAGAKPGVFGAFGLPYRSDSENRAWMAEDPIPKLRRQLVANAILTDEEATQIEDAVRARVLQSLDTARNAARVAHDAALSHVFADTKVPASQFAV
ncbi:MAG: thiamine pyrophosphate-dependent dehydrogenase E1 component subunit alpha [Rhodobacteraceae bacterium]|jgi:pyruvate dehydrogenase E1 component alpha subunit|nr:thiamine pyrophosphate-dependent dehydrogenase E1 component subunit alpha [Paracoccaceae bacterium]